MSQGNIFASAEDLNEPQGLAQLAKDDKWGEPNNGLATQLIPQSEEYVIGKPMKFGLVLKNVSDSVKKYNDSSTSFKPLIVKTPDNNYPYDKIGPFSTMVRPDSSIDACEIVILFEDRDITDEYLVIKPGKYTVQFRGGGGLPISNIVEFEVKPGKPNERDFLVSLLINILPDESWRVAVSKKRNVSAEQKENAFAVVVARGGKMDGIGVMLWQTKTQGAIIDQRHSPPPVEYLGKNNSDYFYISIPPKALDYWPKMKEDIAKALKLDSQKQ
jgi:hypothetical protein